MTIDHSRGRGALPGRFCAATFGAVLGAFAIVAPPAVAQACVPASQVADADGDFRRMARSLEGLCITEDTFSERGQTWRLQWVASGRPGPLWVALHDNEHAAFDAGVAALRRHGGTLVAVETGGNRNNGSTDPNRNFSARGVGCGSLGTSGSPAYVERFMSKLGSHSGVISLHTNAVGSSATGGSGTISIKAPFANSQALPGAARPGMPRDEDTLAIVPSRGGVPALATNLQRAGVNVLVENLGGTGGGDCSMSNFMGALGVGYVALEARHGDARSLGTLIDVVMRTRWH